MAKSILLLVSMIGLAAAQLSTAPERVRGGRDKVQSGRRAAGRTASHLRNNRLRELQTELSMSMSMPVAESTGPIGCMPNEASVCPEGTECECHLGCRFCVFPPCGSCVEQV